MSVIKVSSLEEIFHELMLLFCGENLGKKILVAKC